jgi:hypothetical protein
MWLRLRGCTHVNKTVFFSLDMSTSSPLSFFKTKDGKELPTPRSLDGDEASLGAAFSALLGRVSLTASSSFAFLTALGASSDLRLSCVFGGGGGCASATGFLAIRDDTRRFVPSSAAIVKEGETRMVKWPRRKQRAPLVVELSIGGNLAP